MTDIIIMHTTTNNEIFPGAIIDDELDIREWTSRDEIVTVVKRKKGK